MSASIGPVDCGKTIASECGKMPNHFRFIGVTYVSEVSSFINLDFALSDFIR